MSTREIVLDGGSPWGFRMHGGADVGQPLRISRVNPGSKAAQKGIREGDVISSINGQSTRNITNSDAHALLRNAGQTLQLGLNEECSGSPKRRIHRNVQQETKLESVKRSTVSKTSTTARTTSASVNGAAYPNFNSQLSVKGDLKDGQNGGVKESSNFTTSESKGVWCPTLKSLSSITEDSNVRNNQEKKDVEDAPPVVWTPKSAGASPTSERKEFRPINFESPPLPRKTLSATSSPATFKPADDLQPVVNTSSVTQEPTTTTTFSSIFPPWQQQQSRDDSTLSVGSNLQSPTSDKSVASSTITSTLDRRLVQSQSAPASGLSALAAGGSSNIRLPRAQNPTITLLQKAREGQLPRGALYLDHKMNSKEEEKPYISPNEILFTVKKEYESEGEKEQRKKIMQLGPRKFEGIGPMTKEGIPIVLRSEVKDANQAKWYKRMYDSLHRTGKDDEYVTIRYKPRRGDDNSRCI